MKLTGVALPSLTSATVGNVLAVQLCVLAVVHGVRVKNNSLHIALWLWKVSCRSFQWSAQQRRLMLRQLLAY